jgi:hypothetical protein
LGKRRLLLVPQLDLARWLLHPVVALRPRATRAHGAFQGLLNHAVVALAEGDIPVPPDVEAVRLQGLDERLCLGAIGGRVAQKDGAHLGPSVRYHEAPVQESMRTVPPAADVTCALRGRHALGKMRAETTDHA